MKTVGILIFNEVEVLDFAGPFEVFSICRDKKGDPPYKVFLIAEKEGLIKARNNFLVQANYTINNHPDLNMLLIPGGLGTRQEMHNGTIKGWIKSQFDSLDLLLSVCTGSLVLATCGLLDKLAATTHHKAIAALEKVAPNTQIIPHTKYVDNGKIITAAGISAGIEMALHVVAKQHGSKIATKTAKYMEYDWNI